MRRHESVPLPGRRALSVLLSAVLAVLAVLAAPLQQAQAGPTTTAWSASGPYATTTSDGTRETSPAFSYGSSANGRRQAGSWFFTTTAATAGPVTLPYTWTGDHGRTGVRSALAAGVLRNGTLVSPRVLVAAGPADAGAAGFRYTGSVTLTVQPGDVYGFALAGSHSEKVGPLQGTFTLAQAPTLTLPDSPVLATAQESGTAAVSYDVSAATPDGAPADVACTPASGSDFPTGSTEVRCTATSADGLSTSGSFRVAVRPFESNVVWAAATPVAPGESVTDTLRSAGQAYWYRFPVTPDSTVQVDLTELAADYDLALFRDIGATFDEALSTPDLDRLGAEFAADAFAPSIFSPSIFSPSIFSPSIFSPSIFSPSIFSPSIFSPSIFSPSIFSPSIFSPSIFSPSIFSPSIFSPSDPLSGALDPEKIDVTQFTPEQLAQAFSSAQTRSLVGVSVNPGLADESVRAATWGATGSFYVRVQAKNGLSVAAEPFRLAISVTEGACAAPLDTFPGLAGHEGVPGGARTVVLTDSARLPGLDLAGLQAFAALPEVDGVVIDAATLPRVRALNEQADAAVLCPYAKNLVARELRDAVNSYRDDVGTLEYVVIAGGDDVVPFFRSADAAGIGPEQNYFPPVADGTGSESALRRNTVLSQDGYGSSVQLTLKGADVPVPDLAVGRLVETPAEIAATLASFTRLDGQLPTPTSSLVTGYDFLTDAADAVAASLDAGLGPLARTDELITDREVPPGTTTPAGQPASREFSWTADDLRQTLFDDDGHDIVYLAGHFSANNALAADYETTVDATEVLGAPAGVFADTLVLSAGCHSGYSLLDTDAVPGVSEPTDWVQALTRSGATLLAGTGYQYGDTDFIEYSERLYAGVTDQLRVGSGPVPLGRALLRAKQDYLATTPVLSGIHQKALLEATLYGLPMLTVDLPAGRTPAPVVTERATSPVATAPGSVLGLRTADVRASAALVPVAQPFTVGSTDGPAGEFSYLRGPDGVTTSPAQPALPLQVLPATAPGFSLRGVGFRGGSYVDTPGVVPLLGAPTTEVSEVHTAFRSPTFLPRRLATANAFGSLTRTGGTSLLVTPAQYRSDGTSTATQRQFSSLDYRLTYSANTTRYGTNVPALAAPPTVTAVTSTVVGSQVRISARVAGDPSAGIQSVWVTRTAERGPFYGAWSSLDLTQDPADSTLWTGVLTLPAGQAAADVRFLVQAVNGVGLVTMDDNEGFEHVPGVVPGQAVLVGSAATTLTVATAASPVFGSDATVQATLRGVGPLPGRSVRLTLGSASALAVTDADGVATAVLPVAGGAGPTSLAASFDGDPTFAPARAAGTVTVARRATTLDLVVPAGPVVSGRESGITARLVTASGVPLRERTVTFVATDDSGATVAAGVGITDRDGVAELGSLVAPAGTVTLTAGFGIDVVDLGGGSTAVTADAENLPASSAAREVLVRTAPRVLTGSLPTATAGEPYSAPVDVDGSPEPDVSVTGLPAGLEYRDGRITGTATVAGELVVTVTATSTVGSDTRELVLTVRPGAPRSVLAVSGGGQSVTFGAPFEAPLVVDVVDAFGNTVPGVTVTFTSPATGAGTDPRVTTAVTGPAGRASVLVTAGRTAGGYQVTATAAGVAPAGAAAFRLVNRFSVSPFSAPLDRTDGQPVPVRPGDVVRVSASVTPLTLVEATRLTATCSVRVSSRPLGSAATSSAPPRCAAYDARTARFTGVVSGTAAGWVPGSFHVLTFTVLGPDGVEVLGLREVVVRVVA